MEKVNVIEKFSLFTNYWSSKIVGELNGQHVKFVKFKGDFIRHLHENEDELFFVIKGKFKMQFRGEREVEIGENEFLIVPKGVEHRSSAEDEAHVIVFEPTAAVNTGNINNELTVRILKYL
ncbi:MAG: cupin domain-containing protein [Ignavibacteria bacterium]|nr:cupin domain-containing protein [Ignavibacteria bacterium]